MFSWALSADEAPDTVQGLQRTTTATSKRKSSEIKSCKERKQRSENRDVNTAASRLEEMWKPSGRRRHKSGALLLSTIDWLTNDKGLHALRTLILTIALGVPGVITASVGFCYPEKGLWALIMAQLSLMP